MPAFVILSLLYTKGSFFSGIYLLFLITTVMITQVKVKQKGRPLEQNLKGSIAYMLELP